MVRERLRGTGVALVTPFTSELTVDYEGLRKLLDFLLEGNVNYLVVNGTTAESATTTFAEKTGVLDFIKQHINGRLPLMYGIGGNNTAQVIETIAATDFEGIDAILSVSPAYNKPSQQGIYQHFLHIAEASPVPVMLYNVPTRTSSNMTADTTLRLALHQNIVGIKEASGNLEQCLLIAKHRPEGFLLVSGDDMMAVPMISFGAEGAISVLGNAYPEKFSSMVRQALDGNFKAAAELLLNFVDLNPLLYEEGNPVGVKVLLERFGICTASVRLPLVEASAGLRDKIDKLI